MIKLEQKKKYLSLSTLENYELNDFSVLTGLNGSGKTHLLLAIESGIIEVKNIDISGITYYNYSDFNLFYGDVSKDADLQNKNNIYTTKSNAFAQNLTMQRNEVLNAFKFNLDSYRQFEHLISSSPQFFSWTEDEIVNYEIMQADKNFILDPANTGRDLTINQSFLTNHIAQNFRQVDIRKLLLEINTFLTKNQILTILKNNHYNLEIVKWDELQIEKYETAKILNPDFQIPMMPFGLPGFNKTSNSEYDSNFANFIYNINQYQNLKGKDLLILKKIFHDIYLELVKYFKETISADYLQLATKINGEENILNQISVDNGFLNLQEIANAEKSYQISKEQNQYNKFKSTVQNQTTQYYSDNEFAKIHGDSPITLLNEVLYEYDCNGYEFRESQMNFQVGADINNQVVNITLFNKKENFNTTLNSLSSGEKTLIALSFYLFKLNRKRVVTNLLLLDEVDSALHPSMSKRLLDVLYNIFYKKMGIKIIISSHSPSTVALAPEKSLFVMNKYSKPKIASVSKDMALKTLTYGVPSFSINYENRRQVFVESEYDVIYYESLYNIYHKDLNADISLNFISSGKTKINGNGIGIASCNQVISVVKTLRTAGNNFIWGIIDWDLVNMDNEYVKVLGNNKRYSIENYLLDPLLLAILLWKESFLKSEDFGFDRNEVYYNVVNFDQKKLQKMIDKIISDLNSVRDNEDLESLNNYNLFNGTNLQIPKWYCETQGHFLEKNIILKKYPQLQSIIKKEDFALKKALIDKVILNFRSLASMDLINIFKNIQKI